MINNSLDSLTRKIRLGMFFENDTFPISDIPYNDTASKWICPPKPYDNIINNYIDNTKHKINNTLQHNEANYTTNDKIMSTVLTTLKHNKKITIKPADKNLGLTILDTSEYKNMCYKHLNDTNTYKLIDDYSPDPSYYKLRSILNYYKKLHINNDNTLALTKLASSLTQLHNHKSLRIAPFYCLPKIHKSTISPIPGRPIASSIGTLTYHTSVYLDTQLQPILKHLHTVCTSSNNLILAMTNFKTNINSVILCADVTSLYPNIPINKGINTVYNVIKKLKLFSKNHLDCLMHMLHWVLTNNYCTFDNNIYLQIKGTAMGTPVATTYANIFLYGIENEILLKHKPIYYTRYIDDIFAIYDTHANAQHFINDFNNVIESITLEAVTIKRDGVMLDLTLSLIQSHDKTHDYITHSLYQKPANIYQYIPTSSHHKPHIFTNFINQEINRINLRCTNPSDFETCINLFKTRLINRGYSPSLLTNSLTQIPTRQELLDKIVLKSQKRKSTDIDSILLVTLPQLKLIRRTNWSEIFDIPDTLKSHPNFINAFKTSKIIIGTKNNESIGAQIISSKFN